MRSRATFTLDYWRRMTGYGCEFAEGSESYYERLPDCVTDILIRREYEAQQMFAATHR